MIATSTRAKVTGLVAGACAFMLVGWMASAATAASSAATTKPAQATTTTTAESYPVSDACVHYEPNKVEVDGDVNQAVSLSVSQIEALPGQETLNISYLNHLGTLESFSETGPLLWNVLNIAAGGLKVPPPTPNQYAGPSPQTALYIIAIGTDGYQTVIAEGEIDPGFGNAPILLGYAEDGVLLTNVPYSPSESKGPAQLVVPGDTHGGRYANQICRIKVASGAL
jgi:hypothetical protein